MPVNKIPNGYTAITPSLAIKGASEAIEFYKKAFGATVATRLDDPAGNVAHAELVINGGMFMLSEEHPQYNQSPATLGGSTVVLHLYVDDVDAVYEQAIKHGAESVIPVADQFYGDRSGRVSDPYGYLWVISTHIEDVSEAEMQKRFKELCGG